VPWLSKLKKYNNNKGFYMKKITLPLIFLSTTLLSVQSAAVDGLSANVGATNNYLWRGLEQTNGKVGVSGGIDYKSESGFYAGTWVSNAEWSEGMTYELDLYGGFSGQTESFSYDIGLIHYAYPDSVQDVDFTEINASLTMKMFTLGYAVLADAEGADFADDSYISLDAEFEIATDLALVLHLGRGTDDFYAGEAFIDYGASLHKNGFSFGVSKTDLDNDDIRFVVSYSVDIDL